MASLSLKNVTKKYPNGFVAVKDFNLEIADKEFIIFVGPSGCGKSTFLRSLNRMNDTIDIAKGTGQILDQGGDVKASNINVYEMRKHIGMVFQRPNPFAKSIYRNITFAHEQLNIRLMYLKKFEYFILDSSVAGTLLLMALAIRIEAINAGFDQFSSNIIFISVFIISIGLYISMQIALYEIIIFLCHHSKSLSIHEHLNDSVIAPEQAFMGYEKLRSNTITEQKRTNDKKLELVHTYIHQTMAAYTSQENLQRLCAYISDFFQDKTAIDIIPIKVDSKLKAIDVMHLGWNIGKALGKRRSYTAEFIKKVFADTMKENEINTIIKKMSHSETECLIKLNPHIIQ